MGKMKAYGLDAYMAKLSALEKSTDAIVETTIKAGAEIVEYAMLDEIAALPTSEHTDVKGRTRPWFGTPDYPARGPSEAQKQGLLSCLGTTPVSDDGKGFINAKVGFHGYNSVRSKQYPDGEPNLLVARAVNSGTSFMKAHPFAKTARSKSSGKARQKMKKTAEKALDKQFNSPRFTGKHSWEK